MAMRIVLKHSGTVDDNPTPDQLPSAGEIALNYHSSGAFLTCKDTSGAIHQIGGVKISSGEPANPIKGKLWVDTADGNKLKIYDGITWIELGGSGGDFNVCVAGGIAYDANNECYFVDWSLLPTDASIDWNAANKQWGVNWAALPTCTDSGLAWDTTNECWSVDLPWADFPTCTDGGLTWDTTNECWSVDTPWADLPVCDSGGLTWDTADECWSVDLPWADFPTCDSGGLSYNSEDECWNIDWSELPTGDTINWDGTNELWDVDWEQLPADNSLNWDDVNKQWGVDWAQFPGGRHLNWDATNGVWDADDPIIVSDTKPTYQDNALWLDSTTDILYVGYGNSWVPVNSPFEACDDGGLVQDDVSGCWSVDASQLDVTSVISQDDAPAYKEDQFWYETDTGNLYIGYDDYWVRVNTPGQDGADGSDGSDGVAFVSDTPPASPTDGQIWHNTDNGIAYVYWDSQGVWVSM